MLQKRGFEELAKAWQDEGLPMLRGVVNDKPKSYRAQWRLGNVLATLGAHQQAIVHLRRSVDL